MAKYVVRKKLMQGGFGMKILAEMPTGMGGKWLLAEFEKNFFGYGLEKDFSDAMGLPVDQCGTKEAVKKHCDSIAELCRQNIKKYQTEISEEKENAVGWKMLLEHEQKELEMLTRFSEVLCK